MRAKPLTALCEQAGLDLDEAKFKPITSKDKKVTSAVLMHGDKFMICTMGSNSIPKNTGKILTKDKAP